MTVSNQAIVEGVDEIARCQAAGDAKGLEVACRTALERDVEDVRATRVLGELLLKQGRYRQASQLLDRAAQLAPEDVEIRVALGEVLAEQRLFDAALAVLRRAATLAPEHVGATLQLGRLLHRMARFEEAYALARRGLEQVPAHPALLLLAGQCQIALRQTEQAGQHLLQAADAAPDDAWPRLGMALNHFLQGELPQAFAAYRWRQRLPQCQPRKLPQPRWLGGDAVGKTLLVYAEQGLGDALQFMRYLPLLVARGASVLLDCPGTLHPLLRGMRGVTVLQARMRPQFDAHVSLLDLPDLLGTTLETVPAAVPYLQPPQQKVLMPPPPGCRLRVGIVWAGNPRHNNSHQRDARLEHFLPLTGRPGVEFFSLQLGEAAAQLAACGGDELIEGLGPHLRDMGVTAAVMADLDLVITVDTAAAHLAGALGRPVWVLLPYLPDWRWMLDCEDSPWYPGMRLFRQPAAGDWNSVFARVGDALDALLETCPAATATAPPQAVEQSKKLRDRAIAVYQSGNRQEAKQLLRRAIRANPQDAALWNNMGILLRDAKHAIAAEASYRRALGYGGESAGVLTNLGNALNDQDRCDEAVEYHRRALQLEPESLLARQNLGVALRGAGRHQEAVEVFDQVLAVSPDHYDAHWDRSQSLLHLGCYQEGWQEYEWRWQLKEAGRYHRKGARWDGAPFQGKTLLLVVEQGFGDTLLALRFLPRVKALGGRVLLECQPELMRLIGRTGWVDAMFMKNSPVPEPYDFQLPLMSLPGLFGQDAGTISGKPYLQADAALHGMFANLLQKRPGQLNVGIVWSGSVTFKGNAYRAQTLEPFLRFAAVPGVRLFSLQKGPPHEALKQLGLSSVITDLAPLMLDFDCSAAALEMLDLVIMTDSATVHLAGALGRPVWVLLGSRPYWLWGMEGEACPWYDSVRLLRQPASGDWDSLFALAEEALRRLTQQQ